MLRVTTLLKKSDGFPQGDRSPKLWGIGFYNETPVTFWGTSKGDINFITQIKVFGASEKRYDSYLQNKLRKGYKVVDEGIDLSHLKSVRLATGEE